MGLSMVLARWIGKKIGVAVGLGTEKKAVWFKFEGHNPWEPKLPPIPFSKKIQDLKTDAGLTQSYVADLIAQAKSNKSLMPIKKYLESSRNDLPYNVTKKFLGEVVKKLDALKQELADAGVNHQHIIHHITGGWFS